MEGKILNVNPDEIKLARTKGFHDVCQGRRDQAVQREDGVVDTSTCMVGPLHRVGGRGGEARDWATFLLVQGAQELGLQEVRAVRSECRLSTLVGWLGGSGVSQASADTLGAIRPFAGRRLQGVRAYRPGCRQSTVERWLCGRGVSQERTDTLGALRPFAGRPNPASFTAS